MKIACTALLSAVFATAVLGETNTLREDLIDLLSVDQEAELGIPKKCRLKKYKGKKYVDNECEETTTGRPACSCREACKVWGDPYLAPFYSECFTKVFKKVKHTYTLWNIPASGTDREELNVEAYVDNAEYYGKSAGSREWVMQILINGKVVADAKTCDDNNMSHDTLLNEFQFNLKSDIAIAKKFAYEDVKAVVEVYCRESNDRSKTKHLSAIIKSVDYGSKYTVEGELEPTDGKVGSIWEATPSLLQQGEDPESWTSSSYVPPDTTHYFESDFGACTNPVKYGDATPFDEDKNDVDERLTCRVNDNSYKGVDVRECSCDTQCAMFGDPWVFDYFSPHFPKKKGKKKVKGVKPFKIDKKKNLEWHEMSLYSFWDHLDVQFTIDDCERIDSVIIRQLKPQYLPQSCDLMDPKSPGTRKAEDIDNLVLSATKLCKSTDPEDATKIVYPPTGKMDLGYLGISEKGEQYYLKSEKEADLDACAAKSLESIVNLGSVRIVLKCHARRDGTPFFNVCVQREDAVRKYYVKKPKNKYNPKSFKKPEKFDPKAFSVLLRLEEDAQTSGWCSLGDYTTKNRLTPKLDRDREHRASEDIVRFPDLPF